MGNIGATTKWWHKFKISYLSIDIQGVQLFWFGLCEIFWEMEVQIVIELKKYNSPYYHLGKIKKFRGVGAPTALAPSMDTGPREHDCAFLCICLHIMHVQIHNNYDMFY